MALSVPFLFMLNVSENPTFRPSLPENEKTARNRAVSYWEASFFFFAGKRFFRAIGKFDDGVIELQSKIRTENRAEFGSQSCLFRFFFLRQSDGFLFSRKFIDAVCSGAHALPPFSFITC